MWTGRRRKYMYVCVCGTRKPWAGIRVSLRYPFPKCRMFVSCTAPLANTHSQVGDEGVSHLAALRRLTHLDLSGCAGLTDAAAVWLARLTALKVGLRGGEAVVAVG